ncbi:nitroreductase family protein [Fluviispira sanaruensis]|uniref:Nitroreductase family protein n=1 Tax=Fluviispira sanaruensis TaxID=2493639 RepID=A0A4P2VIU5_FLUSA|nr:nitroreductase family protein [Fluviispira sanaruensis]BBH53006.1 nitroreductase family protein [Fluviispira sanaruensis]
MNSTLDIIKQRTSVNKFDPAKTISENEIKDLISYAIESPSSFNIQHWRFIALTNKAEKEKLKAVAFNQEKITDASVTFIVLGDIKGLEKMPDILSSIKTANLIDQQMHDGWLQMANGMYKENPALERDEAIRSASMAAMTLMLAAQAKGFASGAMIGFDPVGVKKEFQIPDRYVPVMLLAVGYLSNGNWPRKPRLSIDSILSFNKMKQF